MSIDPESILGVAVSTVTSKINDLDALADKYNALLTAALTDIGAITVAPVEAPIPMAAPNISLPSVNISAPPTYSPPTLTMPSRPATVDIAALLEDLDIGEMDDLPDAPVPIPLNIPDAPTISAIPLPVRPDIDTQVDIPSAPTVVLPEMEELIQLQLPVFEFPELPVFNETAPTADGLVVPDVFINWAEPKYESELFDQLHGEIVRMMAGGSGLPEAVEDALFSRARQRESNETKRAIQEANDTWASRNFSMPPGMLNKQVDAIREAGRAKAGELNRDIMIEGAKWQIESLRFAVQQGMALEQITANLFENTVKRLFEVARFQAESQINVFNARITLFNAQNAAFETLAGVYRTKLEAAISKLTAYKIAIEGQGALGQINQQRVDVFKAKLESVMANVEVYKAMMSGAQVRAETIKNQFDAYRADIQAFAEQIGAEKVKFDAYESQLKAESSKANMLDSQSRAYASTIQAISSKADLKVKGAQLKMDAARTWLTKYSTDNEAYRAEVDASLREVQYSTQVFQSQVEAWRAGAGVEISQAEMLSRFADLGVRTNIAYAEMQMSEYTAKMQSAIQQAQIALESAKSMGQYTAQLAAGAMSAAHVSASISGGGSASSTDTKTVSHSYSYER